MYFDNELPVVHIYPHNVAGNTEHQTDDGHECWCEPRVVIVPPGHKFAMEKSRTRVVYHSNYATHADQRADMPIAELLYSMTSNRILRAVPEPPAGGYEPILIAERIDALVADVLTNGWEQAPEPVPAVEPTPTQHAAPMVYVGILGLSPEVLQRLREMYGGVSDVFDTTPTVEPTLTCADCGLSFEDCTCDEDDDDEYDSSTY